MSGTVNRPKAPRLERSQTLVGEEGTTTIVLLNGHIEKLPSKCSSRLIY